MKRQLISAIATRLAAVLGDAATQFNVASQSIATRHCAIDDLLPIDIARRIHAAFPPVAEMQLLDTFRERKRVSRRLDAYDPILTDVTFALQDSAVVELVERITGLREQRPDPSLYASGLSAMTRGHFLNPHIDNSHDGARCNYRTLNLLYYVTPNWRLESGGHLELWDTAVRERLTIESRFNRLVLMETTPTSWHSVSPVVGDGVRCCVSNYYFSPVSPIGRHYFNVTSYSARPEQPVRRALALVDAKVRQGIRALVPRGLRKPDLYRGGRR